MTHLCSACERFLRETCPACGRDSQAINANAAGHPVPGTDFLCSNCGLRFPMGEGGESHEICEQCGPMAQSAKAAG